MAKYRTTNGHRAAVCGLILLGMSLHGACAVAGVPYKQMRAVLPPSWRVKRGGNPKWRGEKLAEIRDAYCEAQLPLARISELYGLSRHMVLYLAKYHGWPRRHRRYGMKPLPIPLSKLDAATVSRYRKLQHAIGRDAAEKVVFG